MIKHQAGDYKTGRAYGQRPPMVIAPHIYPEVSPPQRSNLDRGTAEDPKADRMKKAEKKLLPLCQTLVFAPIHEG